MATSNAKKANVSAPKKFWNSIKSSPLKMGALVVGIVAVLGAGTVVAADPSKPGDLLYSIDRAAEQVQLAFSFSDDAKTDLHLSMAKERLTELQALFDEKDLNAPGIAVALANFEKEKHEASDLAKDSDRSQEVEDELEGYQSTIDDLFEQQQKAIETWREALKKQAEEAEKAGNTALAAQLRAQAATLDDQLRTLESQREASKQQQEKLNEALESDDESESEDEQEALTEAVQKEVEAQREAAKQVEEQQREADRRAAEEQAEAEKKAQEEQQHQEEEGSDEEDD